MSRVIMATVLQGLDLVHSAQQEGCPGRGWICRSQDAGDAGDEAARDGDVDPVRYGHVDGSIAFKPYREQPERRQPCSVTGSRPPVGRQQHAVSEGYGRSGFEVVLFRAGAHSRSFGSRTISTSRCRVASPWPRSLRARVPFRGVRSRGCRRTSNDALTLQKRVLR